MVEAGNEVVIGMSWCVQPDLSGSTVDGREVPTPGGHVELRIAGSATIKADPFHRMDRRDEQVERVSRRLDPPDASH